MEQNYQKYFLSEYYIGMSVANYTIPECNISIVYIFASYIEFLLLA